VHVLYRRLFVPFRPRAKRSDGKPAGLMIPRLGMVRSLFERSSEVQPRCRRRRLRGRSQAVALDGACARALAAEEYNTYN